jgi:hypothetical protein
MQTGMANRSAEAGTVGRCVCTFTLSGRAAMLGENLRVETCNGSALCIAFDPLRASSRRTKL